MKNLAEILKYIIITGVFAILFVPFFIPTAFFFPFISGKGFAFRIIVEIILGSWIILALYDSQYRPKKSILLYSVGAFLAIVGIADAFGVNTIRSLWSNYERMEGYITLLHVSAYFLVVSSVFTTARIWNWFWNTSIFASVIMCVYGFFQLAGKIVINQGGVRLDGTFGNAVYLAVYMLFHILITSLYLTREKTSVGMRVVYGVIIFLQSTILFYTATRGTILGLIGGTIVTLLLIALFDTSRPLLRKLSIAILMIIVVSIGGFFLVRNNPSVIAHPVLSRFATISVNENTTKSRFMIWNMAVQGFKERPILGWGQENFNLVFNKYYDPRMYNQEQWFDRAHNVFFDWLINAGILGLLAYLSIFGSALYMLWKKQSTLTFTEKSILTGMLVGYFIHNIFVFDNLFSYVFFFSVLAYIASHTSKNESLLLSQEVKPQVLANVIAPLIILLTITTVILVNKNPIQANRYLLKAVTVVGAEGETPVSCVEVSYNGREASCSKTQSTMAVFQKALAYSAFSKPEIREHLLPVISKVNPMKISDEEKNKFINFALNEMITQTKETPADARYHFILGSYLANLGQFDAALASLDKAIALSPKKQPMLLNKGQVFLAKKEVAKAVPLFKQAYELEKNNLDAKKRYVLALVASQDKAQALQVISEGTAVIKDPAVIGLYYDFKNYDAVITILKDVLMKKPDDIQAHISLAGIYVETGRKEEAIAELQNTITAYPAFKIQGEKLIKDIKAGKRIL